jgi:hypothetical protein
MRNVGIVWLPLLLEVLELPNPSTGLQNLRMLSPRHAADHTVGKTPNHSPPLDIRTPWLLDLLP